MNGRVEASAPGKLLLTGEYAVLEGAPAIVLAVDRRVRVRIRSGAGRFCSPELGFDAPVRFDADGRCLRDTAGRAVLGLTGRFVPRLLESLEVDAGVLAGLDIEVDSAALHEHVPGGVRKLGLGSSAAVSAALGVALCAWLKPDMAPATPEARLAAWLPVYREALQANASGADLAAALFGGSLVYRNARARRVQLPADLQWLAVWTGQCAQTTDFVAAFGRWRDTDAGSAARLGRLAELAERAVQALDDAAALIDVAADWVGQLDALGVAIGKPVISDVHRRIADWAGDCGVVYKSCGAGGGDLGIALARDGARLAAFSAGVAAIGGNPLKLAVSAAGAGLEGTPAD